MNEKIHKYLQDILNACDDIEAFVAGTTRSQFEESLLIQRAVEREFEIIGEALNRIIRIDEQLEVAIGDCAKIIGFRNIIAHGYDIVEPRIMWSAIQDNLPQLKREIQGLLAH